jgi:DNA-binding transcriptional LysR family regulator
MLWFISAELWRGVSDLRPQALLDRFPVLLMPRPSFYFHRGLNALRGHGLAARRVNTCSNTAVTLSLIEGGTGIGLLPEGLARAHNSAGQLVQVLHEVPVEPIEYLIVRHHENNLPQLDAIIDMAVAASRSLLTPRAPTADRSSPP